MINGYIFITMWIMIVFIYASLKVGDYTRNKKEAENVE